MREKKKTKIGKLKEQTYERIWEIDAIRGFAVILMILYHTAFDVAFFSTYAQSIQHTISIFNISSLWWNIPQSFIASLFLIIVGISLYLSWENRQDLPNQWLLRTIIRGIIIFLLGMIVSWITWIFLKEDYIRFGILHLIGGCIILSALVIYAIHAHVKQKKLSSIKWYILLAGVALLMHIGLQALHPTSEKINPFLLSIGIIPLQFSSVDYYPLLPWIGVVLAGIGVGIFLVKKGYLTTGTKIYSTMKSTVQKKINTHAKQYHKVIQHDLVITIRKTLGETIVVRFLCLVGKHALLIYFIHQPIILGVFYVCGLIPL